MAEDELLERLRAIARREGLSLAAIMRQGLEWRAKQTPRRKLSFIGAVESDGYGDTSEWASGAPYEPLSWR